MKRSLKMHSIFKNKWNKVNMEYNNKWNFINKTKQVMLGTLFEREYYGHSPERFVGIFY